MFASALQRETGIEPLTNSLEECTSSKNKGQRRPRLLYAAVILKRLHAYFIFHAIRE